MTDDATCNYPYIVPDCNGGSSVFDRVAYLPELYGVLLDKDVKEPFIRERRC